MRVAQHSHCGYLAADKFSRELGQALVPAFRPSIFDCDGLTFNEAGFGKALAERPHTAGPLVRRGATKDANDRHRRALLRPRGGGPRRRHTDPRDDLPSPHSITSSARARSVGPLLCEMQTRITR